MTDMIKLDKLITNRKSLMGFRLVQKSVILNDHERCNGHYGQFRTSGWLAVDLLFVSR